MEKYLIPLVPGPVAVPQEILKVAARNFGSADCEPEYAALYRETAEDDENPRTGSDSDGRGDVGFVDGFEKYVKAGR